MDYSRFRILSGGERHTVCVRGVDADRWPVWSGYQRLAAFIFLAMRLTDRIRTSPTTDLKRPIAVA